VYLDTKHDMQEERREIQAEYAAEAREEARQIQAEFDAEARAEHEDEMGGEW